MVDQYGRNIHYLRVSITDRCNLQCNYCIPKGCVQYSHDSLLTYEEIERIIRIAADLGIDTIRITGGEPLVRKDVEKLVHSIKHIKGIQYVTMTTNGVLLGEHMDSLIAAGLTGVNVSLDTLDAQKFSRITGFDELHTVKQNIFGAAVSVLHTKVNCVLQKGINDLEIAALTELAKENKMDVRFIELMPIGQGKYRQGVSNEEALEILRLTYPQIQRMQSLTDGMEGAGPAEYYTIPGFSGRIGFISAIHGKFCNACNRVRITAEGYLKGCLADECGVDLKTLLRSGKADKELAEAIRTTVFNKPMEHHFEYPDAITENKEMFRIGG